MIVKFNSHSDARGSLVAIESEQDVPFTIERVYFIFGTKPDVERGCHAHRELQQLMICTSGACTVTLDSGGVKESYVLDEPTSALFVDRMIWREMSNFSNDAVLMVLASRHYDAEDYIRKYEDFLAERRNWKSREC